jgi:hypothetical protein
MPSSSRTANSQPAGARGRTPTKTKKAVASNGHDTAEAEGEAAATVRSEDIAQRAFEIYEREGRPEGKHLEHWLRAEQELRSLLT